MATIRASWRRLVQTAPYESETLELAVERSWDEINDGPAEQGAAELSRTLSAEGDKLLVERLSRREGPKKPDRPMAPGEPW